MKHGKGRFVYKHAIHEGSYYRDKRHGHGRYICDNGDVYDGNFGKCLYY